MIKKLGAMLMAAIMVLSLTVSAFAANNAYVITTQQKSVKLGSDGTATITYNLHKNVSGSEKVTFEAENYDIVDFLVNKTPINNSNHSVTLNGSGNYTIDITVRALSSDEDEVRNLRIKVSPDGDSNNYYSNSVSVYPSSSSDSSQSESEDEPPYEDIGIYLESYSCDRVLPGGKFKVKLTLKSTADTDLYLYVGSAGYKIVESGSNKAYIYQSLKKGSNKLDLILVAPTDAPAGTNMLEFILKTELGGEGSQFSIPINVIGLEDEEEKVTSTLTPHIIITGYKLDGEVITPGEDIRLTISFMNTSKTQAVENLVMGYTLPGGMALKNASSSFYFASVPAGGTASQSISLSSDKTLAEGIQNFGISFNYQYKDNDVYVNGSDSEDFGLRVSSTGTVASPDRFEISSVELPDVLYLGNEGYITINMINKGSTALNNVTAKINSDQIKNDGDNEYFGMLNANTKDDVELAIEPIEEGTIIGTITISYEHEDGEVFEVTRDFSVYCEDPNAWKAEDPGYYEDPEIYGDPVNEGLPMWAKFAIGGGIVAAGTVATVLIVKRNKKKKLEEIDDEDI